MPKGETKLGELELEVLKVIWEREPATVPDVAEVMAASRGSAKTTTLTVMQRLHAKGYLKRRKRGGIFHYSTTEKRGRVMSRLVSQFVGTVLDGSALPFVAYLAETKGLSKEQAAALRRIVREVEDQPGEEH